MRKCVFVSWGLLISLMLTAAALGADNPLNVLNPPGSAPAAPAAPTGASAAASSGAADKAAAAAGQAKDQAASAHAQGGVEAKKAMAAGERININTASAGDLAKLPGIGPAKAKAIVAARPFAKPEDIKKVKGIKEGVYKKLEPMISVQ